MRYRFITFVLLGVLLIGTVASGAENPASGKDSAETVNLLVNGSFEEIASDGGVTGWRPEEWRNGSRFLTTTYKVCQGETAIMINSEQPNDARFVQNVKVKPDTCYQLSGWVAVAGVPNGKIGASIGVMTDGFTHSAYLNETTDWTRVEYNFRTAIGQTEVKIAARLGYWGNEVSGTAYFDNLRLVEMRRELPGFNRLEGLTNQLEEGPEIAVVKDDNAVAGSRSGMPGFWFSFTWFGLGAFLAGIAIFLTVRRCYDGRREDGECK